MQQLNLQTQVVENAENERRFDLRQIWRVIDKHKWAILVLTILATAVAALFVNRQIPVYRATATLLIERSPVQFSPVQDAYAGYTDHWLYYQTQYGLIKRRAIGERVVNDLDLATPAVSQAPASSEGFSWRDLLPDALRSPAPAPPSQAERVDGLVSWIVGGIQVSPRRNSQLVDVSFSSTSPREAADIANAVADAYIADNLDGRVEMSRAATDYLTERLVELKDAWEQSEQQVQAFLDSQSLLSVQGADSIANQELTLATEKLSAARQLRLDSQIIKDQIDAGFGDDSALLNDPQVATANDTLLAARRKVDELGQRYGPKHPRMIEAQSELSSAQSVLDRQAQIARQDASRRFDNAQAAERAANAELELVKGRLRNIDRQEFRLQALQREADKNREIYEQFLTQYKSASASGDIQTANARVVEQARAPGYPVWPNKKRSLSIAFMLSLLGAVALAFLLEHLDNTFKTADDLEKRTGLAVLGVLPRLKTGGKQDLTPFSTFSNDRQSLFSEAIRTVRTGVLLSDLDADQRILLVTSSVPGEGKTTLSVNLARAMAEMKTVLLIDADMRRPMVATATERDNSNFGLSHFIAEEAELKTCIHQMDAEGDQQLFVMPAGNPPPNPLEMLSSQRFAAALDRLSESFDYIVIDCAPALAVSDAMVLSKLATSVVYVVKSDSTPVQAVQTGVKRLGRVNAHLIGAVLNSVELRSQRYYGKYGAYGMDYYAAYGKRTSSDT
ncbi:MAG: polysaccharide biosynthesis tyrosine autokinase [Pseudomonadota bacterium]